MTFEIIGKGIPRGRDLSQRSSLILMLALLLLAFALGAYGLDWDNISSDELNTLSSMGVFDGGAHPARALALLPQFSPDHKPVYFLLAAAWAALTGESWVTLRLLSLLIGILTLAWLFRLAADLFDRRIAIAAVLLMGTNALAITQFHNIRMYALIMLLSTLHFWLYWQVQQRQRDGIIWWLLFFASCAALLYTHNFTLIFFFGVGAHHLLFVKRSRRWWNISLLWALGFALFLPSLPQALLGVQFNAQWPRFRPLSTDELAAAVGLELVNHFPLLWLPLGFALGWITLRHRSATATKLVFISLAMFAGLAAIDALMQLMEWTRMRYFLVFWSLMMIAFAAGLLSLPRRRLIAPIVLLLWIAAGLQLMYSNAFIDYWFRVERDRDYPPLHRYVHGLRGRVHESDFVVGFRPSDFMNLESRTLGGTFAGYYLGTQLGIDGLFLHASLVRYRLDSDLRQILRDHPYILLAHDPGDVPSKYARTHELISEAYLPCTVFVDDPDLRIQRYAHPVVGCDHQPAPIQYDNGIRLIDQAARFDPERQIIEALLWWDLPREDLLDQFNFSLQIITPDWQNMRQVDHHLHGQFLPWSVNELSTDGLPAGDYRLMLIVYERESGNKVSGLDDSGSEAATILPLLNFQLEA